MQTFNSFNELVAAQGASPLVSNMSVFNLSLEQSNKIESTIQAAHDSLKQIYEEYADELPEGFVASLNKAHAELGILRNKATGLPLTDTENVRNQRTRNGNLTQQRFINGMPVLEIEEAANPIMVKAGGSTVTISGNDGGLPEMVDSDPMGGVAHFGDTCATDTLPPIGDTADVLNALQSQNGTTENGIWDAVRTGAAAVGGAIKAGAGMVSDAAGKIAQGAQAGAAASKEAQASEKKQKVAAMAQTAPQEIAGNAKTQIKKVVDAIKGVGDNNLLAQFRSQANTAIKQELGIR